MSVELRDIQKHVVPKGVEMLKKHHMAWLTGQEGAGKTIPALCIFNEIGYKSVLCITTIKAGIDIRKAYKELGFTFSLEVINYESIHKIVNISPDAVWLDESHKLSQFPKKAIRVDKIKRICYNKPIIYSTATPSAEGYYKLFHQFYVSSFSPLAFCGNAYGFIRQFINVKYQIVHGQEKPVYTDVNMNKLWPLIGHLFITWTREDAGFKVETTDKFLWVKMSDKCIDITRKLKKDKIYMDEHGNAALINGGAQLISKLSQLGSGTLKFDETVMGTIDPEGTVIDTTKALFIRSFFFGKRIAIFYLYAAEGKLLRKVFPNHTSSPDEFNASDDLTFIEQVSKCEGYRLFKTDDIVYFTPPFSATIYSQSRARHLFKERDKPANAWFIMSEHGIEDKIYKALSEKKNFTWSFYANKQPAARVGDTIQNNKVA